MNVAAEPNDSAMLAGWCQTFMLVQCVNIVHLSYIRYTKYTSRLCLYATQIKKGISFSGNWVIILISEMDA